jgi:membrane protease subunit (stomatin/prohibitin family)
MAKNTQGLFTRGIFQFEDPSGCLIAAKVPQSGTIDLYAGTRVIVGPNQAAIFIYNGQVTDTFREGNHEVLTDNFPILTKLANWRFGFDSPLQASLWFFSLNLFQGRRWGTRSPILLNVEHLGSIPVRAHGNYNIRITDLMKFFNQFVGSQASYDITQLEEFIQGQILEELPKALASIRTAQDFSRKYGEISERLEQSVNAIFEKYGLELRDAQVLGVVPPAEVLRALEERVAMEIIGDKKEYLLYKVANAIQDMSSKSAPGSGDPSQVMMSLLLSQGFLGMGAVDKERGGFSARSPGPAPSASPLGGARAPQAFDPDATDPTLGAPPSQGFVSDPVKCAACFTEFARETRKCPNCGLKPSGT